MSRNNPPNKYQRFIAALVISRHKKKPNSMAGLCVSSLITRKIDMIGLISLIRSLKSTSNHAAFSMSNPSASRISPA